MMNLNNVKGSDTNYFVDRLDGTGKAGDTYLISHSYIKLSYVFYRKKNPTAMDKPVAINFNATSAGAGECTITGGSRSLLTGSNIIIPTDNEITIGYWGYILGPSQVRISTDFNSTSSVTAGIQEAILDLPTSGTVIGGEVYIPPGTYIISQTIGVPTSNVILRGAGWSTILVSNTTNNLTNISASKSGITIRDMVLNGNSLSPECIGGNGTLTDINFINLEVKNAAKEGIYLGATNTRVYVGNCYIHDNGWGGYVMGTAAGVIIENCTIKTNHKDGVTITAGNGVHIRDCEISGNFNDGVWLQANHSCVSDNYIHNNVWNGIDFSALNNVTAKGNVIELNAEHGINYDTGIDIVLQDNTILDNGSEAANTYSGINVGAGSADIVVTGNCIGNRTTANEDYCCVIANGVSHVVIVGNVLQSPATGQVHDLGAVDLVNVHNAGP